MHIELVDTHRNVRIVPTKMLENPLLTLEELRKHASPSAIENAQVLLIADQEFMDGCTAAAASDPDAKIVPADQSGRVVLGYDKSGQPKRVPAATFAGIPINVMEA